MAPVVHVIDPDPDTVLILRNPCTTFAPWDSEEKPQSPVVRVSKKERKKKSKRRVDSLDPPEHYPSLALDGLAVDSNETFPEDRFGGSNGSAGASSASEVAPSLTRHKEPVEPEEESIHYHVSSRHLMLASPVFKRALNKDGFTESVRNEIDGFFHVQASDWDPEAFLIVLQILHGRNKQVPRKVSLDMLAKIAILEDYYTFGESLDVFTEMWIQELIRVSIPTVYCRDLVLWIWVAWLFDKDQQFEEATTVAIKQSTEALRTLDLPIPPILSDEIDNTRYQAIEFVIEALHDRLERYRSTDYLCPSNANQSFMCGSFLLGSVTKELSRLNFMSPRPEVPFPGLSFDRTCELVGAMQSPWWYSANGSYSRAHSCTLNAAMKTLIEDVSTAVGGLNLGDLKKRRDS
ncbi:hypothetical protein AA0113_g5273 [Alternaria arborescens]|uniref:BTB domain-containing protein n=1 Tax=Alternaria arborescens TaxID=156630 RepID=A0A4Q4S6S5_9PLEO|nr:hypothetical protein AA0113_g5273 [Alternaria arborescens]